MKALSACQEELASKNIPTADLTAGLIPGVGGFHQLFDIIHKTNHRADYHTLGPLALDFATWSSQFRGKILTSTQFMALSTIKETACHARQ